MLFQNKNSNPVPVIGLGDVCVPVGILSCSEMWVSHPKAALGVTFVAFQKSCLKAQTPNKLSLNWSMTKWVGCHYETAWQFSSGKALFFSCVTDVSVFPYFPCQFIMASQISFLLLLPTVKSIKFVLTLLLSPGQIFPLHFLSLVISPIPYLKTELLRLISDALLTW